MSESALQEAQRLVHGDRGAAYGHPLEDFSRSAAMWSAILGVSVTAEQVGLCMIAVKISRQCNAPKRDNMVDAAGYAETVQMCIDERKRRGDLALLAAKVEPSPVPTVRAIITPLIPEPMELDE